MIWFDEPAIKKFKRIPSTELVHSHDPPSHERKVYNKEFWDTTTLVMKFPLNPRLQEDLEKHGPLNEQFR